MANDENKTLILRRLYSGAFEDGVDYHFKLEKFAQDNDIDKDLIWKIFDEMKAEDLMDFYTSPGLVKPTTTGLLYCEENELVEKKLIEKQSSIRTKLLESIFDIHESKSRGYIVSWEEWINEAGVNKQDFANNKAILRDLFLVEKKTHRSYVITPLGRERVYEYKKKVAHLESFEKLEALTDITPQQRGHKLEDLLAEKAKEEGWEVEKRVRSQGQEHDLIMHVGTHYFFVSCKWEQDPIQPKDVELLESRVRSRATTNGGLFFSMSGFTDNSIEEVRLKMASVQILLFGPLDIRGLFKKDASLTDLLDDKLEQTMHHRKILIDGEAK